MEKTKSIWLMIGNTEYEIEKLRIDHPDYPLALSLPITVIGRPPSPYGAERGCGISIHAGIFCRLGSDIEKIPPENADRAIEGFGCYAAVSCGLFIGKLSAPSSRDVGNCFYMAKWGEGSLRISPDIKILKFSDLDDVSISMKIDGAIYSAEKNDYLFAPSLFISFLSGHISMKKGDLICLGATTASAEINDSDKAARIEVSAGILGGFDIIIP